MRPPSATLTRARTIAIENGVQFAYTGNVHDPRGSSTWCPGCGELLIERDWYQLGQWGLDQAGACSACGTRPAGHFDSQPGEALTRPVRLDLA